jgi:hypothetical protein
VSVVCLSDPESALIRFLGSAPENCSWCWRPLIDPVVLWALKNARLAFHPECAADTLIFEARRAKMASQGQSLLGGMIHAGTQ